MTTARNKIVDLNVTRYYHCISRCVRGAFLCGGELEHRKQWLEDRLEHLANSFAVSVAGFAVMDNHLHVLVRIDPDSASDWSDEEVIRRWLSVYPPRGIDFDNPDNMKSWLEHYSRAPGKVAEYRARLANMGWFMKALKEPLSRMANREDGCRGAFWAGRFKSIAILDEEALLATCAYIDLNPLAAGLAQTPEASKHTSIRQRITHVSRKHRVAALKSAMKGTIAASRSLGNVEQDHWLVPLEDRRTYTRSKSGSKREGMLEKFTLGNYLILVEYTGRLFRKGKARISSGIKQIFKRLESSIEFWNHQLHKMLNKTELRGVRFRVIT